MIVQAALVCLHRLALPSRPPRRQGLLFWLSLCGVFSSNSQSRRKVSVVQRCLIGFKTPQYVWKAQAGSAICECVMKDDAKIWAGGRRVRLH